MEHLRASFEPTSWFISAVLQIHITMESGSRCKIIPARLLREMGSFPLRVPTTLYINLFRLGFLFFQYFVERVCFGKENQWKGILSRLWKEKKKSEIICFVTWLFAPSALFSPFLSFMFKVCKVSWSATQLHVYSHHVTENCSCTSKRFKPT